MNTTTEQALAKGYTQRLTLIGDVWKLDVLVQPDTDLDGQFRAFCLDECEFIRVSGWLWTNV